ncbi:MAG: hypothetical protein V4713_08955 [Pseudomonadota bacterium]
MSPAVLDGSAVNGAPWGGGNSATAGILKTGDVVELERRGWRSDVN